MRKRYENRLLLEKVIEFSDMPRYNKRNIAKEMRYEG